MQEHIRITNANADPFTHFVEDLILRGACPQTNGMPTYEQATLWWEEMDLHDKEIYEQRAREWVQRQMQPVEWPQPNNVSVHKRRNREY